MSLSLTTCATAHGREDIYHQHRSIPVATSEQQLVKRAHIHRDRDATPATQIANKNASRSFKIKKQYNIQLASPIRNADRIFHPAFDRISQPAIGRISQPRSNAPNRRPTAPKSAMAVKLGYFFFFIQAQKPSISRVGQQFESMTSASARRVLSMSQTMPKLYSNLLMS